MDVFVQKVQSRPINGKHSLVRKLGEGGQGGVYLGRDLDTCEEVALKLEHQSIEPSILEDEAENYRAFHGIAGFPDVYWYGWHDDYKVMAFELLGPSLDDLFTYCGKIFSLKTTLLLADQLLIRLCALHSRKVVHRDVKPQNFLAGSGANSTVIYVVDLGLMSRFASDCSTVDNYVSGTSRLVGTTRFASIRGHEGRDQSPRDDLESLGYMLVYFMRGRLPWQGLNLPGVEKEQSVMERKKCLKAEQLCKGLPKEFADYMRYVKCLSHGEMPDYSKLRDLFRNLAKKENLGYDAVFDWTILLFLERSRNEKHSVQQEGLRSVAPHD
ncbi:hypothetical protein CERZMDRAFT_43817 [Cercospora zeae-maydis SCOH1-5]|uniref:Protein kinase domain-containing protein n=1 Tax=Cercospora zeae-maydis SCOH1-5 TaxID=717836 RepID=A0A6A6FDC4_9PEZI|nr:hypothetical protein CERZMDRAFT_43817 [Cercospora zeae-maydis SCOH1-5]